MLLGPILESRDEAIFSIITTSLDVAIELSKYIRTEANGLQAT